MAATLNGSSRPLYRTGFPFVIPGTSPRTNSLRPNRFPMLTFARLSVFAIAAGAVVSSRSLPERGSVPDAPVAGRAVSA